MRKNKITKTTIDGLARMIKAGFDEVTGEMARKGDVDKQFEEVDRRFESVDKKFEGVDKKLAYIGAEVNHVRARVDVIERDVSEIRKHFVYRDEFEDALARILLLEKKVGIKSGK